MVDADKLRRCVAESGYKLGYISERLGLSRSSLTAKIRGKSEFFVSEVQGLGQMARPNPRRKEGYFFLRTMSARD